jgi:hypothetical protein
MILVKLVRTGDMRVRSVLTALITSAWEILYDTELLGGKMQLRRVVPGACMPDSRVPLSINIKYLFGIWGGGVDDSIQSVFSFILQFLLRNKDTLFGET